MISATQGKVQVQRMVRRLLREGRLAIDGCRWERSDVFTNPSTPVLTLSRGGREVASVCVTRRKLERMDRGETLRSVQSSILGCYQMATTASSAERKPPPRA